MTTTLAVKQAFKAAVEAAGGTHVVWGQAIGVVADPIVKLELISNVEEIPVRVELSGSGDLVQSLHQYRILTMQIKAETVNGDLVSDASDLANTMAMGLWRTGARAALKPAVLVETGPVQSGYYRTDERIVHAWFFEAKLRAEMTLTDPTTVGVIERVESAGTTADPTATIETIVEKP